MRIDIFHRTDEDRFWNLKDSQSPTLEFAYSYEDEFDVTDPIRSLERVFRRNNRVDGSAIEVVPEDKRSLSTGDAVVVYGTRMAAWTVESFGWGEVPTETLINALT